jgi:hypothetical protein
LAKPLGKSADRQRFDERGNESHGCGNHNPTDDFRSALDERRPHNTAPSAVPEFSLEHFSNIFGRIAFWKNNGHATRSANRLQLMARLGF